MRSPFGILFMLLLAWSCTDNCDNGKRDTYPVQFSSGLAEQAATRAVNDSWDAGDQVGIYMIPATADASDAADFASAYAARASNVPYIAVGSGVSVSLAVASGHNPITFPEDNSPVNFVAYYPYHADTHTTNYHIYKVDVATQSPPKAIDLLYHKGTGTPYQHSATDVPLEFTHRLSKLKINLLSATGISADLTGATMVLTGFPATANFDLRTGVLDAPGTTDAPLTSVKLAASESRADFEAIVVPHANGALYTRTLDFTIQGATYSYPVLASATFKEGLAHSYNFKFMGDRIVLIQNTIVNWDGGTIAWGDYLLTASKTYFDLTAGAASGHTVALSVNTPVVPVWALSADATCNTDAVPQWITGVALSAATPGDAGWYNHTLTFDNDYNIEATPRTGYIRLEIAGLTLAIRVTQPAGAGLYADAPQPAAFVNLGALGRTGYTFGIKTNIHEPDITVSTTNAAMITNLTNQRGAVAADGSFVRTVGFDVTMNLTGAVRTGNIDVAIGGGPKTVSVSQATMLVPEANCYMVPPGVEAIAFNPTRAVSQGGAAANAQLYATVLWDDADCVFAPVVVGTGNAATVIVTPTGAGGNAVIAIRTGSVTGNIAWSYHIWVTAYTGGATWTNNNYTFMDRNLGASAAGNSLAGRGLLYQWGRKDPFPGAIAGTAGFAAFDRFSGIEQTVGESETAIYVTDMSETPAAVAAGILEAIRHPATFYSRSNLPSYDWLPMAENTLWDTSGTKSVYDPCPAGWRVPLHKDGLVSDGFGANSPWYGLSGQHWTEGAVTGGANWGTNALYPAAGFRFNYAGRVFGEGSHAYCWTASVTNGNSYSLRTGFNRTIVPNNTDGRSNAFSVRCVRE